MLAIASDKETLVETTTFAVESPTNKAD